MLDFTNIENYRENNRIEAKKALGGLPHSIWETYSAFANTMGGIILLGVEEYRDKTFHTVDLPMPERLVSEFFELLNDKKTVSVNILSENDVRIHEVDGNRIIAINIPRARRADKPVYVGGDPKGGTYRRNGEGDYKCTPDEIAAMIRDAELVSVDMAVAGGTDLGALDPQSVSNYCLGLGEQDRVGDADFLAEIGAVKPLNGEMIPTVAGLLMFGRNNKIVEKFPDFSLEYIDGEGVLRGENLWRFYISVCERLFAVSDDDGVRNALYEALANSLVNADYNGIGGIKVINRNSAVSFSNPGGFRIDVDTALGGGVSDPRNCALTKMFNLAGVGKGTGSGIPNIYRVWKSRGFSVPIFEESFDPDRVTLTLELGNEGVETRGGKEITAHRKDVVADYLTVKISATRGDISDLLGVSLDCAEAILSEMIGDGIVVSEGEGYRLRA